MATRGVVVIGCGCAAAVHAGLSVRVCVRGRGDTPVMAMRMRDFRHPALRVRRELVVVAAIRLD